MPDNSIEGFASKMFYFGSITPILLCVVGVVLGEVYESPNTVNGSVTLGLLGLFALIPTGAFYFDVLRQKKKFDEKRSQF